MSLTDVNFVETDTDTIKREVIAAYEKIADRTLAQGDPIRLFLETIAAIIAQQRSLINYTGKMNLLAYAAGDYLDHLGRLVGTDRLEAAAATATFKITLSAARSFDVTVAAGTRVRDATDAVFAMDEAVIVKAGETTATVKGRCTTAGSVANGYAIGEICNIVDPNPYVATIENTTVSEGGADVEDDESYRARIQEAPEHFSVAGSSGAYRYFAMTASALISDVKVTMPEAGVVNVYPLLNGGRLPGEEIIESVKKVLSADDVRPLTDKVQVVKPTIKEYEINLTYYIDVNDKASESTITAAVKAAIEDYVGWQRAKLGRDINPTELYYRIRAAGAKRAVITLPEFAAVATTEVAIAADNITVTYGGLENG